MPSHDETNESAAFQRNRLRHRLLPALREENPDAERALARAAAALREVAEALDWAAERALADLAPRRVGSSWRLPAARLSALPAAVAKRVLQRLTEDLGGSLDAQHLDATLKLARAPSGKAVALPKLTARRQRAELILEKGVTHKRPRRLDESETRGYH